MIDDVAGRIRAEATMLAGQPADLVQRAAVYHHLYARSDGNHVFPLLAAHGALWAAGHFRRGLKLGPVLAIPDLARPARRRARMASLAAFAEAFREINRQVCVETYVAFHLTERYGDHPNIGRHVAPDLAEALARCHHAQARGAALSSEDRRAHFLAFFLWEQAHIVEPGINAALAVLDWPLARAVAMRPPVNFSYFGRQGPLWFRDFAVTDERIDRGREAFEIADVAGFPQVEAALSRYGIMPPAFSNDPARFFDRLRDRLGLLRHPGESGQNHGISRLADSASIRFSGMPTLR